MSDYQPAPARGVVYSAAGGAAKGGGDGVAPGAFATFDPDRKGTGTTLTQGNLRAGISGLFMACLTHPIDITGNQVYYAELTVNSGAFLGVGITLSSSATDQYNGAYAGQCTVWQDGTSDNGGGMSNANQKPNYVGASALQLAVSQNQFYLGIPGTGWWDPQAIAWTGNPALGVGRIIYLMNAGLYSLAVTSISTINVTINTGASAWQFTPPAGAIGFPG